jgi:hypothetical protein
LKKYSNNGHPKFKTKKSHIISEDFLEELKKFFLEATGIVVLGTRLEAIQSHLDMDSEAQRLMKAAMDTNARILKTDNGLRLWRFFETQDYKKINESQVISFELITFYKTRLKSLSVI